MQTIDVSQAQSLFPRLIEAVVAGDEVIITRNAEPFVKLSLVNGAKQKTAVGVRAIAILSSLLCSTLVKV